MGGTLPSDITATVFTAIVAKEVASDTVQFQLTADGQSLEMLMNGIVVDFSELAEQEFTNVVVYDPGNNTLAATFSSGVYLEVRAQNGFLSTLLLSLSQNYQGMTAGLMGNYNGNTEDDLLPLGGLMGLPLTSSLEDIHFMFGVTCEKCMGIQEGGSKGRINHFSGEGEGGWGEGGGPELPIRLFAIQGIETTIYRTHQ